MYNMGTAVYCLQGVISGCDEGVTGIDRERERKIETLNPKP